MKQVDFIIVGAGLAGSLLAKELRTANYSVHLIDNAKPNAASRVAIGLTNPITGKRLVKSWLIDELIPKAKLIYKDLESQFGVQLMHDCEIARVIPNQDIFEQWQPNFKQAVKEGYIEDKVHHFHVGDKTHDYFLIKQAFWVNTKLLVEKSLEHFAINGMLNKQEFDFNRLIVKQDSVSYGNVTSSKIIFCEGAKGAENPFFSDLPFNLNKGEVVRANITDYNFKDVLKKNIFILQDGNSYRIGATYNREQVNEEISPRALDYFSKKLDDVGLSATFFDHKAAIRPATVDRRPFIGEHSIHKAIYIFNGFGAKGVSLIPYFAEKFVTELSGGEKVVREASTRRFFD